MPEQRPNSPYDGQPTNQENGVDLWRPNQIEIFLPLVEQTRTLNKLVQAITQFAAPLDCGGGIEFRFKEVVVMSSPHNELEETGLTRVCGLTHVVASKIETLSDLDCKKDHSEFVFAYVPNSKVQFFIAHPHDLQDKSRNDTTFANPISTQSEYDIIQLAEQYALYRSNMNKEVFSDKASEKCASDQAIFDEVYKSACDPVLNPHLFAASFAS